MDTSICELCKYSVINCICNSKWTSLKGLTSFCVESDVIDPSPLKISTMTLVFKMSNCRIDLSKLYKDFEPNSVFKEKIYKKNSKKSKDEEINKNMYNQCELKGKFREFEKKCKKPGCEIKDCCKRTNLSLFIFKNGSFKMTGLKNNNNIVFIVRFIDKMLKDLCCLDKTEPDKGCFMKDIRICLINTNFLIFGSKTSGRTLNQTKLNEILNRHDYSLKSDNGSVESSIFDTETHQGINTKIVHRKLMEREMKQINKKQLLMKKKIDNTIPGRKKKVIIKKLLTRKNRMKLPYEVTALIFKSGSIIITGGKEACEILYAYEYIINIIQKHATEIIIEN
jgi:hypothetical protein